MEVTFVGHACVLVKQGGTSLIMDPWLTDPTYSNSWFHYPPLEHGIEDLAPVDYVWCSHDHPDHFDPPTLAKLPRDQKILVPQFASGRLQRKLEAEGFTNLIPLEFGEAMTLGDELEITCLRTDLVWEDSALIVKGGGTTLFNMNDCKLGDELLQEIGVEHRPDIAFVPFSGAIHFPTCYDYTHEQMAEMCKSRRQGHLDAFVSRIKLLGAKHAVPFAGNFALLAPDQVWMNEPELNNINTPDQAVDLLASELPDVVGLQMNPGDRWTLADGLTRLKPAPDFGRKMEHIRELAAQVEPKITKLLADEAPARPTLGDDVAAYFHRIADNHPEICGRIDANVILEAEGEQAGRWRLNFHEGGLEISRFADGDPWNLWMTIPSSMLQRAMDRDLDWDDCAISFRMRMKENPEFFNRDFWVMLYNNDADFLGAYLADPAPKF